MGSSVSESRFQNFERILLDLARSPSLWLGDLEVASRKITEVAAKHLGVSRCGIWLFSNDGRSIRCVNLFRSADGVHSSGNEIHEYDFPRYFDALKNERSIAADDARTDSRTSELCDVYLVPHEIVSMLDSPILRQGEMAGVLCNEHTGSPRVWSDAERSFSASIGDLTALAVEAANLKRSESRLEEAQRIAGVGSWFWELREDNLTWSDETYRAFGREPGSLEPDFGPLFEQIVDGDREMVVSALRSLKDEGTPFSLSFEVSLPDGDSKILDGKGWVTRGRGMEQPTSILGTFHDVTTLVRARAVAEARQKSVAHFETLFEYAPHYIMTTSEDLRLQSINRAVGGLALTTVIGTRLTDLEAPSHSGVLEDAKAKIMESKGTQAFELCALGEKKSLLWYDCHMAPIMGEGGEIQGFVIFAVDATEIRHLREQLTRARTLDAVGRLAGGIAHDFNNITMAIRGYADLALRAARRGEDVLPLLERLERVTRRAKALTSQLPSFAAAGDPHPRVVELNEEVMAFIEFLEPIMGDDVSVSCERDDSDCVVEIDVQNLERILLNLSINARQAMDGGKGSLKFEILRASSEGGSTVGKSRSYAVIAVSDDGVGMDKVTLENIFQPFYSNRTSGEGTGLGLFTSLNLVEKNDGFIRVESVPGLGTTFRIYLPLSQKRVLTPVRRRDLGSLSAGTETVLLAEDDPDNKRMIELVLKASGYDVVSAPSGEEALKLSATIEKVDLLLTDVRMGKMSGVDLALDLREEMPTLKVIFVSAFLDGEQVSRVPGMQFLQKPVSPSTIAREVRRVLDDDSI